MVAVIGFSVVGPEISECINNAGPLPLAARVTGCTGTPCVLPQLEDVPIDIIFRAVHTTVSMSTTATAFFSFGTMQLPIPFELSEKSVTCNYLINSTCPVKTGSILLYTLDFFVDPVFPIGSGTTIEFTVWGDHQDAMMCFRVPLTVQSPLPLIMQRKSSKVKLSSNNRTNGI
ncbi:uncharacterized protein [Choristoneura fumiferana]|uniref:uncharacterized protein n=1 Tax=Choristoneura fumiferana TaxID=7141 RepID=UPI003D15920B